MGSGVPIDDPCFLMIYPWFLMIRNKTPRQHQGATQQLENKLTFCRINCSLFRKSSCGFLELVGSFPQGGAQKPLINGSYSGLEPRWFGFLLDTRKWFRECSVTGYPQNPKLTIQTTSWSLVVFLVDEWNICASQIGNQFRQFSEWKIQQFFDKKHLVEKKQ